jgi:hypothetical protein
MIMPIFSFVHEGNGSVEDVTRTCIVGGFGFWNDTAFPNRLFKEVFNWTFTQSNLGYFSLGNLIDHRISMATG